MPARHTCTYSVLLLYLEHVLLLELPIISIISLSAVNGLHKGSLSTCAVQLCIATCTSAQRPGRLHKVSPFALESFSICHDSLSSKVANSLVFLHLLTLVYYQLPLKATLFGAMQVQSER